MYIFLKIFDDYSYSKYFLKNLKEKLKLLENAEKHVFQRNITDIAKKGNLRSNQEVSIANKILL